MIFILTYISMTIYATHNASILHTSLELGVYPLVAHLEAFLPSSIFYLVFISSLDLSKMGVTFSLIFVIYSVKEIKVIFLEQDKTTSPNRDTLEIKK